MNRIIWDDSDPEQTTLLALQAIIDNVNGTANCISQVAAVVGGLIARVAAVEARMSHSSREPNTTAPDTPSAPG